MRCRLLASLLALAACAGGEAARRAPAGRAPGGDDTGPPAAAPAYAASVRADLRPKRWRQLSLDLQGALELSEDEICKETDRFQCTSLHVVPLGGISPDNGVYEPPANLPSAAGLATERVVLQACAHRLDKDRALREDGDPGRVFAHMALEGTALTEAGGPAQVTELWRRLLMRDPAPTEVAGALALHDELVDAGGDNAAWGVMLCLALGTSTEALTY